MFSFLKFLVTFFVLVLNSKGIKIELQSQGQRRLSHWIGSCEVWDIGLKDLGLSNFADQVMVISCGRSNKKNDFFFFFLQLVYERSFRCTFQLTVSSFDFVFFFLGWLEIIEMVSNPFCFLEFTLPHVNFGDTANSF